MRPRTPWILPVACLLFLAKEVLAGPSLALTDSYTTTEAENFCASGSYPTQWTWDPGSVTSAPAPATDGVPMIKQYRSGRHIATYSILGRTTGSENCTVDSMSTTPVVACGPFGRVQTWRNWKSGDVFEVYPAVYSGLENQPWIGPLPGSTTDYNLGISEVPTGITIRGVTVNGVRPVIRVTTEASYNTLNQAAIYIDSSENITIENIDLELAGGSVGNAGIYINGAKNVTFRDMRIHGFMAANANGILGSDSNSGTVTLDRVELYENGGGGGPEHNIYMGSSTVDPSFTVYMTHSWSHDAFYGHLFKSRAQVNILEGNYFQGGVPLAGKSQAENYLVDIPNGGILRMRNNVLVKNASGPDSNAMSVTFAMEGVPDGRQLELTIENNTFAAFSRYYDGLHRLFPFSFFYPQLVPGAGNFPVPTLSIAKNMFVAYCPSGDPVMDYRGALALNTGFTDVHPDFSPVINYVTADTSNIGRNAYHHAAQYGPLRELATLGAVDSPAGDPPRITPPFTPAPTISGPEPTPVPEAPGKPLALSLCMKKKTLVAKWRAAKGTVTDYLVELVAKKKTLKSVMVLPRSLKASLGKPRVGTSYAVRVLARNSTVAGQPARKSFRYRVGGLRAC